jgi:hypothetical protein
MYYYYKYTNYLLQHKPCLKTEREHPRRKRQNEIVDPWATMHTEIFTTPAASTQYNVQALHGPLWSSMKDL